jgi:putative addiction module component (TIGR02574 family)
VPASEYDSIMSLTLSQIAKEAMLLPATSRAQLADQLVESLADADADEVRQLWTAEAIRRRDEVQSGLVQSIPGEQVVAEVRRMVGRQ